MIVIAGRGDRCTHLWLRRTFGRPRKARVLGYRDTYEPLFGISGRTDAPQPYRACGGAQRLARSRSDGAVGEPSADSFHSAAALRQRSGESSRM